MLDKTRKPLFPQLGTKKTFLNEKTPDFFFQKILPSAEKCERGTLWDLLTSVQLQTIKKLERGTLLRH